jgi:hypothetical protein
VFIVSEEKRTLSASVLGLSDISFPHPLFAGDTLYTSTEILAARPSASRPGQGVVTMRHTGRNQDDVGPSGRFGEPVGPIGGAEQQRGTQREAAHDSTSTATPDAKTAARGALIDAHLDPERVIVRVNPIDSDAFAADMATLSQTRADRRGRTAARDPA